MGGAFASGVSRKFGTSFEWLQIGMMRSKHGCTTDVWCRIRKPDRRSGGADLKPDVLFQCGFSQGLCPSTRKLA
jgi:hypothetical protein